jgi:EF-P beta-lysylation protein EpmB
MLVMVVSVPGSSRRRPRLFVRHRFGSGRSLARRRTPSVSILHEVKQAANTPGSRVAPRPWRQELAAAFRDPAELVAHLGLPESLASRSRSAEALFPLVVTQSFAARMRRGDPDDPLLRQVLPVEAEGDEAPGYVTDPVGDLAAEQTPGLLHKYDGRVLVVAAPACAIHCRYCFRRHFPYDEAPRGSDACDAACAYVAADPSVHEVILSGGDPLLLSDATLTQWSERLAVIPHVKRLRIHSRLPIVLPSRVDDGLLGWVATTRELGLAPWIVVHSNHPAELEGACAAALARLVDAGVPVLNQAVLLRGVNDDAETLTALCERLVDLRVQPYYLHQLDPVAGAAHFHVPEARGRELVAELRRRLPGYAVPRYVRETPGEPHKTDLL